VLERKLEVRDSGRENAKLRPLNRPGVQSRRVRLGMHRPNKTSSYIVVMSWSSRRGKSRKMSIRSHLVLRKVVLLGQLFATVSCDDDPYGISDDKHVRILIYLIRLTFDVESIVITRIV
jgi:hypothetical protein